MQSGFLIIHSYLSSPMDFDTSAYRSLFVKYTYWPTYTVLIIFDFEALLRSVSGLSSHSELSSLSFSSFSDCLLSFGLGFSPPGVSPPGVSSSSFGSLPVGVSFCSYAFWSFCFYLTGDFDFDFLSFPFIFLEIRQTLGSFSYFLPDSSRKLWTLTCVRVLTLLA